jgi:hypothetical protein
MIDLRSWKVALRPGDSRAGEVPASILTTGPRFQLESMPDEVAMLLPTNCGPTRLIERVVDEPGLCANAILGLFLANPFLNVETESERLRHSGVGCITNLPSVDQQDDEFARQLPDVGLGSQRELDYLAQFHNQGFKVAAVVADASSAEAAAVIQPEIMIVIPRVADFAAGFPSLRQRGTAAQGVFEAAHAAGWNGVLLGLGEQRELESEGLWPNRLDGLVCRPAATG